MGGTFDPPHLGHVIPVKEAAREFSLDLVSFIPAYIPPHKLDNHITNPFHRAALLALALQSYPNFLFSPIELMQGTVCYTIDTVRAFHEKISPADSIFFIMGADSFVELETWHDYAGLLQLCQLIIINRGVTEEELKDALNRLQRILHQDLSRIVHFSKAPYLPISSTEIRTALLNRQDVSSWVTPEVEAYIRKHSLYQRR
jgi:nicotinate-nucleotide adenylyltransferase